MDRQRNGLKKKDKRTNNDLQNITHKTSFSMSFLLEFGTVQTAFYYLLCIRFFLEVFCFLLLTVHIYHYPSLTTIKHTFVGYHIQASLEV